MTREEGEIRERVRAFVSRTAASSIPVPVEADDVCPEHHDKEGDLNVVNSVSFMVSEPGSNIPICNDGEETGEGALARLAVPPRPPVVLKTSPALETWPSGARETWTQPELKALR